MLALDILRHIWHSVEYARKQAKATRKAQRQFGEPTGTLERLGALASKVGSQRTSPGPKDET